MIMFSMAFHFSYCFKLHISFPFSFLFLFLGFFLFPFLSFLFLLTTTRHPTAYLSMYLPYISFSQHTPSGRYISMEPILVDILFSLTSLFLSFFDYFCFLFVSILSLIIRLRLFSSIFFFSLSSESIFPYSFHLPKANTGFFQVLSSSSNSRLNKTITRPARLFAHIHTHARAQESIRERPPPPSAQEKANGRVARLKKWKAIFVHKLFKNQIIENEPSNSQINLLN